MKGLILKDIINLKQQAKVYLLIIAIWLAIGISSKDGGFFGMLICVLTTFLPITALSYDEKAKWDKYSLTMPVSKQEVVLSKYILALVASVIGFIISLLFNIVISKVFIESFSASAVYWGISILIFSIILPLMYKFGVEKGRMLILVVFLIPTLFALLMSKLNISHPNEVFISNLKFILPIFILLVLIISVYASIKIYINKEL
jgi:hypothetical protein